MTNPKAQHKKRRRAAPVLTEVMRGFRVEVDPHGRGLAVTVSGAQRILSFSDGAVEVSCGGRTVRVAGQGLSLMIFENRATEIVGRVEEIVFV